MYGINHGKLALYETNQHHLDAIWYAHYLYYHIFKNKFKAAYYVIDIIIISFSPFFERIVLFNIINQLHEQIDLCLMGKSKSGRGNAHVQLPNVFTINCNYRQIIKD